MTQFKVGDEVFVKGVLAQYTSGEHVLVYFDFIGHRVAMNINELNPIPSPPAAVEQPTATQVTQATAVFAGMQRERLWVEFAKAALTGECTRTNIINSEMESAAGFVSKFADAMLAEFDRRGKGGE